MYAKFINQNEIIPLKYPYNYTAHRTINGIPFSVKVTLVHDKDITEAVAAELAEEGYFPVTGERPNDFDHIYRPAFSKVGNVIKTMWYTPSVSDLNETERRTMANRIRKRRETECFRYVDRNQIWKDSLTAEQKSELVTWYLAWLEAPETLNVPEKPTWLD